MGNYCKLHSFVGTEADSKNCPDCHYHQCCEKCWGRVEDENGFSHNYGCQYETCPCHSPKKFSCGAGEHDTLSEAIHCWDSHSTKECSEEMSCGINKRGEEQHSESCSVAHSPKDPELERVLEEMKPKVSIFQKKDEPVKEMVLQWLNLYYEQLKPVITQVYTQAKEEERKKVKEMFREYKDKYPVDFWLQKRQSEFDELERRIREEVSEVGGEPVGGYDMEIDAYNKGLLKAIYILNEMRGEK